MLFSSNTFLFGFLPAVVVLYYLCPRRCRNVLLLVSSLIFYGWGEPKYVLLMLVSILLNYFAGWLLPGSKAGSAPPGGCWCWVWY